MADSAVQVALRVVGAGRFSREMKQGAREILGLSRASQVTAGQMRNATRSQQRFQRAVEGVGRASDTAAAAMKGAAVGGVVATTAAMGKGVAMGTQYNATLDSQRVAFTTLFKSQEKAASFMRELQDLSAESPVLDPATTGDAARSLLAYGVNVKDVLPLTEALGDMSAASGRAISEVMPRAALAIGQIASKGKLSAEEMNQLAESVGLGRKSVARELGMTAAQLEETFKPGKQVKAAEALPAILTAMTRQSAGAADLLSKTTAGRLDRARETIAKGFGEMTRPLYDGIGLLASDLADWVGRQNFEKVGQAVAKKVTSASQFARGAIAAARGKVAPGGAAGSAGVAFGRVAQKGTQIAARAFRGLAGAGRQVLDALKPAAPFFQNVLWPLLKGIGMGVGGAVVGAFKIAVPIIRVFSTALGWIGTAARPLRPIIHGIGSVIGFVMGGPILKALSYLPRVGVVFRALRVPIKSVGRVFGWFGRVARGAIGSVVGRLGRFAGSFKTAGTGAKLAAQATARGIVKAFNTVRSVPGRVVGFIRQIPGRVRSALPTIMSFFGRVGKAIVNAIVNAIKSAPGAVQDAVKSLVPGKLKDVVGSAAGNLDKINPFAAGGVQHRTGWALVGERGPELARLPGGTRIYPHPQTRRMLTPSPAPAAAASISSNTGQPIVLTSNLFLDGQLVHRSVQRHDQQLAEVL